MPKRNLKGKKGLRPRASARPRDYSETASEISEEFASASEIREKSWLEFGRNSRGIPARSRAILAASAAAFGGGSADFGRASAGPSSLRRGHLIKILH